MLSFLQSNFPELYQEEQQQQQQQQQHQQQEQQAHEQEQLDAELGDPSKAGQAPALSKLGSNESAKQQQQQQQQQQTTEQAQGEEENGKQDQYLQKIESIKAKFESKQISADDLEQYLKTAAEEAKSEEGRALAKADQEYTPSWRHVGLPMKPSHLELNPQTMEQGGLVNPKAIMQEFHQAHSKEVLNPPRTYEYNDASIQPNYLKATSNMKSRKATVLPPEKAERVRTMYLTERKWPHMSEEEMMQHILASEERRRQQDLRMPAAQYELEKKLIASMQHKLAFLRNPRHPEPLSVTMLKTQFDPKKTRGSDGVPAPKPKPPLKFDMTSRPEQVFIVEPEKVLFTDYEVGRVYHRVVKVRNVTSVIRNLRLLPPASQYFHMSMPSFPMDNGCIAPGMAAEVTLRFTPDSLADYDDVMVVDTATNRFSVELQAHRQPPMLTLQQELNCGEVVVGNRKVQQFHFTNEGGHARFKIVPQAHWPSDFAHAPQEMAQAGPFQVWPLYFDLDTGDEVGLNIAFEPSAVGEHRERLVMVCDNCQVKDFTVRGLSSDVGIHLEAVDGVSIQHLSHGSKSTHTASSHQSRGGGGTNQVSASQGSAEAGHDAPPKTVQSHQHSKGGILDTPLWFGEVVPGSGFSRRLSVRNTTLLAFPFKWFFSSNSETKQTSALPGMLNEGAAALTDGAQQEDPEVESLHGPSTRRSKGKLDLVKLGLEQDMGFKVQPQEGVLQPGELAEFYFTFEPPALKRYLYWAQLKVDKTAVGQVPAGCDLCVLEAGLEGLAAPLLLEVAPLVYKVPGTLTPGCTHTRPITLKNPSRAPAHYSFHCSDRSPSTLLTVEPSTGVVPPGSSSSLLLTFSAPHFPAWQRESSRAGSVVSESHSPGVQQKLGKRQLSINSTGPPGMSGVSSAPHTWAFEEEIVCHVKHGGILPVVLAALVAEPRVELVTTRLDFGLLRLGSTKMRTLRLKNASATCGASWALEEMVTKEGGVPCQDCNEMAEEILEQSTHLSFLPPKGHLGPGEQADVQVICFGKADGQHHSIVKLTSPNSGALECLEAFAVVVTPRLVVSTPKVDLGITFLGVTAKFTVKLRNLALLPVEYTWNVEGRTVPRQQVGKEAAAAVAANMLLGGESPSSMTLHQDYTELLDVEGEEEEEDDEMLPAEMKIRPEAGVLDPGQETEVKIRFTPRITGPITVYGVCNLVGAPLPCGFSVSSVTRGLDVMYELLTQDQLSTLAAARAKPKAFKRRDDVDHFVGMTHLPNEVLSKLGACRMAQRVHPHPPRHHASYVANFGNAVPLGEARHMYLVITNCTAIATSLYTHLDNFGVRNLGRLTGGKDQGSTQASIQTIPASLAPSPQIKQILDLNGPPPLHPNPTHGVRELRKMNDSFKTQGSRPSSASFGRGSFNLRSSLQDRDLNFKAAKVPTHRFSAAGGGSLTGPPPRVSQAGSGLQSTADFAGGHVGPHHAPIKLDGQTGRLAPFRSPVGNEMMATRRLQEQSSDVLGSKGLAIHVSPPSCLLGPWSRTVLQLSCYNDMCGDYHDTLHVQVGSLPKKEVAVRVGVSGTPLVVQPERVLVAGLKGRQWRTQLLMGALPVGVPQHKTFYVFNTGSLDMHLEWAFLRYQDDSDCARPEAKIFNVALEPCVIHPPPITDKDHAAAKAAMEAIDAEVATEMAAYEAAAAEAAAMAEAVAAAARKKGKAAAAKPPAPDPRGGTARGGGGEKKGGKDGSKAARGGSAQRRPSSSNTERSDGADEGPEKQDEDTKEKKAAAALEAAKRRHPLPKSYLLAEEGPFEGVKLSISQNAAEDVAPYTVEPRQAIIKGGGNAKFTVHFNSHRAAQHSGFLHGVQKVFSPEVPLSFKTWPAGEDGVGVMIAGTFHPHAGQPPAPLQPLRVDLSATSLKSYLEPDANSELEFVCCSTQPPSHPAFKHVITLTNLQACPLMFSLATEGPFQLVSAAPSVPQDPVIFRGTTGLVQQPSSSPGMVASSPSWGAGQMYLPPQGSVDTTIQFRPDKVDHREDFELSGHLVVRYSNGDTQQLRLSGRILHPELRLSHAQQLPPHVARSASSETREQRNWSAPLVFGQVHVQSPKPLEVILSNPTHVDAIWAVAGSGEKPRYLPLPTEKGKLVAPRASVKETHPLTITGTNGLPPPFRGTSATGLTSMAGDQGALLAEPDALQTAAVGRAVPQWAANEAKFGAFSVWPAAGCLPGRGLHLPRTQPITVTFSPPDNKEHKQLVVFGCSKGRPVALELVGVGSYDETEEHQSVLYQI